LFGEDGFEKDYEKRPELDQYDGADIDDAEQVTSLAARRRAEEDLLKRDKQDRKERKGKRGNLPTALESSSESEQDAEEFIKRRKQRRTDFDLDAMEDAAIMDDDEEHAYALNLGADQKCPLREYLGMEAVRRAVARKFRDFLSDFVDNHTGQRVYLERINNMCALNRESLEVKFAHLAKQYAILAIYIIDAPAEMLEIFDRVARLVVLRLYPDYDRIHPQIHVRMTDLPVLDTLRGIRHTHLNGMITVRGVVTRRTSVLPEQAIIRYNCKVFFCLVWFSCCCSHNFVFQKKKKCGTVIGPVAVERGDKPPPQIECPNQSCQYKGKRGSFEVNSSMTLYRNFQKITLQESPSSVPAGRLPRTKEVILLWDLVDSCRPGEEIEVTGIYRNTFDAWLNTKNGFPVFATVIEANYVGKKEDVYATFRLTEDDERQIRELSQGDSKVQNVVICC
jgi:DNA replication licensing factor MCM2